MMQQPPVWMEKTADLMQVQLLLRPNNQACRYSYRPDLLHADMYIATEITQYGVSLDMSTQCLPQFPPCLTVV